MSSSGLFANKNPVPNVASNPINIHPNTFE